MSTGTWTHAAATMVGSQLAAMGTAPDVITVVPATYGHYQPVNASNWWVNIELVDTHTTVETNRSYLVQFRLGVWVWMNHLGDLADASAAISNYAEMVHQKLLYNTLSGWAREGITDAQMSVGKYIKGGTDNSRYGYHFEVTATKQLGI
jgi:hypothetical protein